MPVNRNLTGVILAGGRGTRLSAVVKDVPKPMASVAGKPFVEYIVAQARSAGCEKIVFCVGYRAESIRDYFHEGAGHGIAIRYSDETKPLGTAGALARAKDLIDSDPFLVFNGDSYCAADLRALIRRHEERGAAATVAVAYVEDTSDYGSVDVDPSGVLCAFNEKGKLSGPGFVNAGVYLLSKSVLDSVPLGAPSSLEYSVFPSLTRKGLHAFRCPGPFIDIGTPESFEAAQKSLPAILSKPLISVLTPSFNCGPYIRECIQSVLAQRYEPFEHIVVDNASTDDTVAILKEYPHLVWVSEPDGGEAHALNKALKMARGRIIGWLNADDFYCEGALDRAAAEIDPGRGRHVVYGNTLLVSENGKALEEKRSARCLTMPRVMRWWLNPQLPQQPSMFFSRESIEATGPFNTQLHFSIDFEYWVRTIARYRFFYVDKTLSCARLRRDCKSRDTIPEQVQSHHAVVKRLQAYLNPLQRALFWMDYWRLYHLNPFVMRIRTCLKFRSRAKALLTGRPPDENSRMA